MIQKLLGAAAALLFSSMASASISFTYTSSSSDPLASFSFALPDNFSPASSSGISFTTDTVLADGNTIFGPITYFDHFTFYTFGGFDSDFDVYEGPVVFSGPTSAPTFINGTYLMDNFIEDGTLVIRGGASATPSVPEPATWAIMTLGFSAVGAAMRRRQKVVVSLA